MLFLAIVFILIILSTLARLYYLVKNSSYNGESKFTVAVIEDASHAFVISSGPQDVSLDEVLLIGKRNGTPGKILGIPIDGTIEFPSGAAVKNVPSDILLSSLTPGTIKKNLTILDILRFYLFTKAVTPNNYTQDSVRTSDDGTLIDKVSSNLFSDQKIVDEQKSIEIVNGTGIDGLGKRLERLIKNSGGNVIAVSNTHLPEQYSRIYYYQETSYTQNKIQEILQYPSVPIKNREIADIRIVIGEDGVREEVF